MGLTTAMITSFSGMTTASQAISVAGENISNVNTTGYKASRADFQSQISQLLRSSSAPTGSSGGTNPTQIGLGVDLGSIKKNFANGAIQNTGVNTEMAIEGAGFFVLDIGGSERYTRAGNFVLDSEYNIVNPAGGLLKGFGVDENFEVQTGTLKALNIPIGTSTLAEATRNVKFAGNLNAAGTVATQGAVVTSDAVFSDAGATTFADAATDLTSLFDGAGQQLFATDDTITIRNARRGPSDLPELTFRVGAAQATDDDAGTTVQDLLDFMIDALGIDTDVSGGAAITNGQIVITGNSGKQNDLEFDGSNVIGNIDSQNRTQPFTFTKSQEADGESARTTFFAFDSLGSELKFDLTMTLESKSNAGTMWRYYVQTEDSAGLSRVLGNGTLSFNTAGQAIDISNATFQLNLDNTGAESPQQISLVFDDEGSRLSALASTISQVSASSQDGSPLGTLQDFSINTDGTILGVYTNGLLRAQGRVALAQFANPVGLQVEGGSLFSATPNSGTAQVVSASTAGAGRVVGGALELSNVEISQEFINLITASTGFSASSRVLTTSDQLIQELLAVIR